MKRLFVLTLLLLIFTSFPAKVHAIYDPLSAPNNKIGIHILFPDEITKAHELVDSNNGDWGYITIPIQAGDKDIGKWQGFMDNCRNLHLIPIIRLATEDNYFDKSTWRMPNDSDVLDFANFLSSLNWPTKNRYIIVFNEVNRADEWEGQSDPASYAHLLSYATTVFKSESRDYFIISAGLDNAASTGNGNYNEYDFSYDMNQAVPGIFNQIDGFSSHSYPNPGFITPPDVKTPESIDSFSYERDGIEALTNKKLPIFITETGWDQSRINTDKVAAYYKDAIQNTWNDPQIVAITPFLLTAGPGPFEKFSFTDSNGSENTVFKLFLSLPKTAGKPNLNPAPKKESGVLRGSKLPTVKFPISIINIKGEAIKKFFKWIFVGL